MKDSKLLHNLSYIYTTENYCLRRIPRLVNLVGNKTLSQLLSDHVSIIMDRLNFVDEIFSFYKTRPFSYRGLMNPLGECPRIFLITEDKENQKLISDLIEVSQYRFSLYKLLVTATGNQVGEGFCTTFMQILNQETKFHIDLSVIKHQTLAILPIK